jgi:DUF4097 and DUF4098 domain-containing protein YvlB
MKRDNLQKAFVVLLSCSAVAAMGCYTDGCEPKAKYERIANLSAPMAENSIFEAQTHNGFVNITGADVTQCSLTATITGWADTEEDAKLLADTVEIKLVPSDNKLIAKIEKPALTPHQRIDISFDVTVPRNIGAGITTHNGALKIKNLTGQIEGTTHNGRITAEKISGTIQLKTHNGDVTCKEVAGNTQLQTHNGSIICEDASGDINLRTHNGSAKAFYSASAPPVCNVAAVSHNGGVSITTPPNFSAKVDASTHNGSINTNLPITVEGNITKGKLTGTIGAGEGELYLETHNGSINIK